MKWVILFAVFAVAYAQQDAGPAEEQQKPDLLPETPNTETENAAPDAGSPEPDSSEPSARSLDEALESVSPVGPKPRALQFKPSFVSAQRPAAPKSKPTPTLPAGAAKTYYADKKRDFYAQPVSYENEINPDGTYRYAFANDNGIYASEVGNLEPVPGEPELLSKTAQGAFGWKSPEGYNIDITYTADANGYQPQGNAIPTAPPIPPLIARSLAYLAQKYAERGAFEQ